MWNILSLWCFLHLALICKVEGDVAISIDPQQVVSDYVSTAQKAKTSFACTGVPSSNVVKYFTSLKIQRFSRKEANTGQEVIIASLRQQTGAVISETITDDFIKQGVITGGINDQDVSLTRLQLDVDTNRITCQDSGQYTCELVFDNQQDKTVTQISSANLTVQTLPAGISLEAKVNNFRVEGTISNPYTMNVGEEIVFTCSGNIGSDTATQWEWMKTGNTVSDLDFIKFPVINHANAKETRGEVTPKPSLCTNSRTTTLAYNISQTDKSRGTIGFYCYAEVSPLPGSQPYRVNTSAVYIQIAGGGGGGDTGGSQGDDSNGTASASAGVIAGAVIGAIAFIVLVVLLVYFLWYRRRGGGDTYTTREVTDGSNPNLAPSAADLYATPTKDRNKHGHENRGMDDHEANHLRKGHKDRDYDRRRYDDDYDHKGHHNYALDDDFESRDGSPSVQHMSDGPIGTGV